MIDFLQNHLKLMGRSTGMKKSRFAEEGILQVATGERYREEAVNSVQRIRPFLKGRPITLVTDKPEQVPPGVFDDVLMHPHPQKNYRDKILPLLNPPYKRTLFLDTDLELLSPIEDIFIILRSVDLVGCHAPVRWCDWKSTDVPEGFCELNSGVLGFRRCWRQRAMVKYWLKLYDIVGIEFDQATLRAALWWASSKRGLRTWVLPPEYNLRTPKPWLTGAGMAVKIVHGRLAEENRQPLYHYLNDNIDQFRSSSSFPTGQNQQILPHEPDYH